MSWQRLCTSFALIFFLIAIAGAQASPPPTEQSTEQSKEEREKAQKELERKALALLDETVEGAQMLKLAENRALIEAAAADMLWPRDEKRARTLFRQALNSLFESFNNQSAKKSPREAQTYWMTLELRKQLILTMARRDPQLALDLLRATHPPSNENTLAGMGMHIPDQELALEQNIAAQVAAKDPKQALQMAEESLAKGVSFGLFSILHGLQQKDSEAATRLAGDIVKKLQTENFAKNREAAIIALNLLQTALMPSSIYNNAGTAQARFKPLVLDEASTRALVDVVVNDALEGTGGLRDVMTLQTVMPELEKRVPERAAQLRKRMSEASRVFDPQMRQWMQFEPVLRTGTTDAILEAATKAPPEMRQNLYYAAAWKLLQAGDAERARRVVTENINGPGREQMLAQIDQRLIARAIEQGKTDEARQLTARIRNKTARASQLAQLAVALANKGERKMALAILVEAQALIDRQPDNEEEINALLQVARADALIEPPRAFEIIEPLIDQANEMLAAAALLDKFGSGRGLFRNGELLLQPSFGAIGNMYAQYGKELAALARADFEHTKTVADRFNRNEARLTARLLIAQSILSDRLGMNGYYSGGEGGFIEGGAVLMSY